MTDEVGFMIAGLRFVGVKNRALGGHFWGIFRNIYGGVSLAFCWDFGGIFMVFLGGGRMGLLMCLVAPLMVVLGDCLVGCGVEFLAAF